VRRSACRAAGQPCSTCSSCGEQPRRTLLSARPRAHGLPRARLMLRPVPSYLPALQNAPGAVQTRACCKPESFGKRPSCRCQSGRALLTLISLCSWNEAPCVKSHLEFDYPSSSLGAPNRILESPHSPLAVIIVDRVHLFYPNRHELPDGLILTMILYQHGAHRLIERGPSPSALTNHTVSGGVESRQCSALIPKPPNGRRSLSRHRIAGDLQKEFVPKLDLRR